MQSRMLIFAGIEFIHKHTLEHNACAPTSMYSTYFFVAAHMG